MNQFIIAGRITTKAVENRKYYFFIKDANNNLIKTEVSKEVYNEFETLDYVGLRGKIIMKNGQLALSVEKITDLQRAKYSEETGEATY